MTKRVMTFLGWGLSSALFVIGTFALVQDEPPIALAIVFILWGILCLPPLYELTQRLEKYGWTWNILVRLGLALLIPAFLAPGISQKDLSFYQRVPNPFVPAKDPSLSPVITKPAASESATPAPITLSGSPLPILKALELKNGQIYVVSDQTSLMASNNPTDIVADIQQMKLIPKGGIFKVLKTNIQKDKQWYQVAAFDAAKTPIGTGWINSATLTEEIAVTSPTPIPSAIQGLLPSPQISSSIATIIAQAKAKASATTSSPNTSPTASLSPLLPSAAVSPSPTISAAPTTTPPPLSSPSKVLPNKTKTAFPTHRVSTEPMASGSRVIIETEDPSISREQCMALVQTYISKAGGKGQVVVYKPNPKPPWNGRVLAFCFNDLNEKGTIINSFYGW
jgi:hypothetical protein